MLTQMRRRLRVGGRVYTGFGPLWNSPLGDHGRTRLRIPWAHTFLPERTVVRWYNRRHERQIDSLQDLGLNCYSLADYRRVFAESGFETVTFGVNVSTRPPSPTCSPPWRAPRASKSTARTICTACWRSARRPSLVSLSCVGLVVYFVNAAAF